MPALPYEFVDMISHCFICYQDCVIIIRKCYQDCGESEGCFICSSQWPFKHLALRVKIGTQKKEMMNIATILN